MKYTTFAFTTFVMVLVSVSEAQIPNKGDFAATFSMVAYDPDAKMWGVVVASKYLAVGGVVPWAKAGVGAVATQSLVNISWGPEGLDLLAKGNDPTKVIDVLKNGDKGFSFRQFGLVDIKGNVASFTGKDCMPWAGEKLGKHYACQGNLLTGPVVLDEMAKGFENSKGNFPWRLLMALDAADRAGGDKRGKQSAAILVVREKGGPNSIGDRYLDLRVDDHPEPVAELIRISSKTSRVIRDK